MTTVPPGERAVVYGPPTELEVAIAREARDDWKIAVPATVDQLSPLLQHARDRFSVDDAKGVAGLVIAGRHTTSISVSPSSLERVVLFLDALIKAVELRGGSVTVDDRNFAYISSGRSGESYLHVRLLGQPVPFQVNEDVRPEQVPLTPEQERQNRRQPYPIHHASWVQRGTGRLTLRIDGWTNGVRATWSDGKVQRIEHCLNAFLVSAYHVAERRRLEAWAESRKRAAEEEERARQQAIERRQQAERRRRSDLRARVDAFQESESIRRIVEHVVRRHEAEAGDSSATLMEWATWAMARADRLEADALRPPTSNLMADRDASCEARQDIPDAAAAPQAPAPPVPAVSIEMPRDSRAEYFRMVNAYRSRHGLI